MAMFTNRLANLSASFLLFLIAPPLISIGTTSGPRTLLWIGLAALCVAALIPPAQRLLLSPASSESKADDESASSSRQEGKP